MPPTRMEYHETLTLRDELRDRLDDARKAGDVETVRELDGQIGLLDAVLLPDDRTPDARPVPGLDVNPLVLSGWVLLALYVAGSLMPLTSGQLALTHVPVIALALGLVGSTREVETPGLLLVGSALFAWIGPSALPGLLF